MIILIIITSMFMLFGVIALIATVDMIMFDGIVSEYLKKKLKDKLSN